MTNVHQPLEPNTTTERPEFSDVLDRPDLTDIPIVSAEEIRASARSSRMEGVVRCDLETVITSLSSLEQSRVAIITPDNETNCGAAVYLARMLSQKSSTILVDMADERVAGLEMTHDENAKGLKDVLAGSAQVSNCVFGDKQSSAHIMPSGSVDVALNENSVSLLPAVLNALQQSYSYLIIDSGGPDARGLGRIADENTNIIVSTISPASEEIEDRIMDIRQAGFAEPIILEMH